jgi:hypothetical protein
VKTYLHHCFPDRWIGHDGPQLGHPDLQTSTPYTLSVRAHERSGVPAKMEKQNKCIALLHLDAATREKDNPNEFMQAIYLIHRYARMCIEAEGGHSEHL